MSVSVAQRMEDGIEVVELTFGHQQIKVAVGLGNTLFRWKVNGIERMWFPYSLAEYAETRSLAGNPFMYPWANRLQDDSIPFRQGLHSFEGADIYRDGNGLPLHGLLLKSPLWKTIALETSESHALHKASLDFGKVAGFMSIFPVAHRLEMEHRLDEKGWTVTVSVMNEDERALPLSFGFHPYFSYAGVERKEVSVKLPFQQHFKTDERLLPTGELEPMPEKWKGWFSIDGNPLDNGFTGIEGPREMWLDIAGQSTCIDMGDDYKVGVVYAPPAANKPYVCLEPMMAPTNALHAFADKLKWLKNWENFTTSFSVRA